MFDIREFISNLSNESSRFEDERVEIQCGDRVAIWTGSGESFLFGTVTGFQYLPQNVTDEHDGFTILIGQEQWPAESETVWPIDDYYAEYGSPEYAS